MGWNRSPRYRSLCGLSLIHILIIAILYVRKVKGALLIGIIATYILGLIAEGIGWYQVDVELSLIHI